MISRYYLALFFLLLLPACLPIPVVRQELSLPAVTYRLPPERVRTEYVELAGFAAPNTPEVYNKALYLRYYIGTEAADTIIVLMPGIFGGAMSLDVLARQLVASTPGLEVWAVDRRANLLEDRSAALESIRNSNPLIAYDYYVKNAGQEGGFRPIPPEELRFLAFWGLEVHLRDLHEIIKTARGLADRVILGGHSLGASLVSFYAAYDFGKGQSDPGYQYIDGLLLIEGALGRTGAFELEDQGLGIGPVQVIPNSQELEAGRGSPYLRFGLSPNYFARSEVAALLAYYQPGQLSPGGFVDFPITNRAAFGLRFDDQYGPSTVFSLSLGEVVGADLAGNLTAVLTGGRAGVYSQSVAGVAEGYDYVDWQRGDPKWERTDLETFSRSFVSKKTNHSEWYFPLRLLIDMSTPDANLAAEPGFVPNAEVTTPTLAVGAGRGLIDELEGFSAYNNARPGALFSSYVLPGLTHLDITAAEDNPLVSLLQLWLKQID